VVDDLPKDTLPLREAARRLGVSVETLRRRAQRMQKRGERGPFIKQGDEWYVIVPDDPRDDPDVSRDSSAQTTAAALSTPAEQFSRVIEQAIAPYAARLEELAIELGATRNELQHERERREAVERERERLRLDVARLQSVQRREKASDAPDSSEHETPVKKANDAPGGVQRENRPSWWRRLFGME